MAHAQPPKSLGTVDVDVVIVGYGPVGVTAANYLGQAGISTLVLEKDQSLYIRARAVTVNDWTLRIFQDFGLADTLKQDMDVTRALVWKTYKNKTIFRVAIPESGLSHPGAMQIYQPKMEAGLRRRVEDLGSVEVRYGHAMKALRQDEHGVTLDVEPVDGEQYQVRAQYVIGSDGGSSRVRTQIDTTMIGTTRKRRWLIIDAEVLSWWPNCNEMVFWSDPVRPVVDIPLAQGNHRWEIPLNEGESDEDFADESRIWERLNAIGITESNVKILGWAFYNHHVRHADRWRDGRVVLLGDAAHLMPPWAGQGMQSGIRDAQNIAWKIRGILADQLDPQILDTYQTERAPHVAAMTDMAVKLGFLIENDDARLNAVRNTVGPVLMRIPAITAKLAPSLAGNKFMDGWVTGSPGPKNALGKMAPQPMVNSTTCRSYRLDELLGQGFVALGLDKDPREAMSAEEASQWDRLGTRFLTVRGTTGVQGRPDDIIDHTGALRAWMGKYRATVIVLRPDRFVAATDITGLAVPGPAGNLVPA